MKTLKGSNFRAGGKNSFLESTKFQHTVSSLQLHTFYVSRVAYWGRPLILKFWGKVWILKKHHPDAQFPVLSNILSTSNVINEFGSSLGLEW